MNHRTTPTILVLLLLVFGSSFAAEEEPGGEKALAKTARTLVERFLAGEYESTLEPMSEEMKSAFTKPLATQVLDSLLARKGEVRGIGDPWLADVVEGNRRFRVPTTFERDILDLLVVFDPEGKVVGFFQAPHVPSPAEREADETLAAKPNPAVEGHWEGEIEIPGMALAVAVDLTFKDGYWVGTIDIPAQSAEGLPLDRIRIGETEVEFAIANVPGDPLFKGSAAGGDLSGTFTQAGQSFPFRLGRDEIAQPARPQEPEPPYPYEEEEVSFENGEVTLAGTLTIPAGEGPFPAVLLVSGSGPQDRNEEVFGHKPFLVLADHLTRAGIAVLRYDDRGTGESTGDHATATSEDFAADARAGVSLVAGREEVDPKRVGVAGHSEGGLIGPMVANGSEAVAFVVMLAGPGVPGDEIIVRQVELMSRASGLPEEKIAEVAAEMQGLFSLVKSGATDEKIGAVVRRLVVAEAGQTEENESLEEAIATETVRATSPWFRFFLDHDPRPVLRELKVPVLALNGEKDLQVDPDQSLPEIRKALDQGGNPDFTVEEMAGLNHLFQKADTGAVGEYYGIEETMNPAVLDKVAGWILERFGEPSLE